MESQLLQTGEFLTQLTTDGGGEAVVFIHGSGPGANGMSNWRLILPVLAIAGGLAAKVFYDRGKRLDAKRRAKKAPCASGC